jgi:two-component system NarL family sensor kinase
VRTAEFVTVEVADTGHGIPAERMREGKIIHGIGIMGIRERMLQLGGSLEVSSSDKGTTVIALLPFSRH